MTTNKSYSNLIELAKLNYKKFDSLIKNIPYENKGILYSEMFFLYLNSINLEPLRIIESGTARGQSTLILSKLFPEAKIISIEYDKQSKDVLIASERLSKQKNVTLKYGDSNYIFPKIFQNGSTDIAIIDGPKGYKAVRLAIKTLKYKNVKFIFVHDTSFDTKERIFLEKHLTFAIYSDHPKLATITHKLDAARKVKMEDKFTFKENKKYGYSLACIQNNPEKSYQHLILLSYIVQFLERIQFKLSKKFSKRYGD